MKMPLILRVLIVIVLMAVAVVNMPQPALSYNFHGLWVGTIKYFAANHTQIDVYSSENRRDLLFVIPPGFNRIMSADGTHVYKASDLKVGTLVRVHVNMPYDFNYYGMGATIGAMYVTRIDILNGAAIHSSIQRSLQQTLPSPTPGPSPTSPPPVPIIFVSPTPG
jgi:hypothetical protein